MSTKWIDGECGTCYAVCYDDRILRHLWLWAVNCEGGIMWGLVRGTLQEVFLQ